MCSKANIKVFLLGLNTLVMVRPWRLVEARGCHSPIKRINCLSNSATPLDGRTYVPR